MDDLDRFIIGIGVIWFSIFMMICFFYGEKAFQKKAYERHMEQLEKQ